MEVTAGSGNLSPSSKLVTATASESHLSSTVKYRCSCRCTLIQRSTGVHVGVHLYSRVQVYLQVFTCTEEYRCIYRCTLTQMSTGVHVGVQNRLCPTCPGSPGASPGSRAAACPPPPRRPAFWHIKNIKQIKKRSHKLEKCYFCEKWHFKVWYLDGLNVTTDRETLYD